MSTMLDCPPGIVFATLSALSLATSAFISWRMFLVDLVFHTIIMYGVLLLCRAHQTTTLWWLLVAFISLPVFVLLGVLATPKCCATIN